MFEQTREALRAFDATKETRSTLWKNVATEDDVRAAKEADTLAANAVREAFYRDTSHVNTWKQAELIDPDDPWLRNLVASTGENA